MKLERTEPTVTVLSFGAGQDSTAILYKLIYDESFRLQYAPGRLVVVFSDTGNEHPSTYAHLKDVKELCAVEGIEFAHIEPSMGYHTGKWQSLIGFYEATNTCGSKAFPKTCTDKLKVQPIYKFLEDWIGNNFGYEVGRKKAFYSFEKDHGKIRVLIGIAKGEERRIALPKKPEDKGYVKWLETCFERSYPLIDLGMDRAACQSYIDSIGKKVPAPSNCMLCPFISEVELLWLQRNHPDSVQLWIGIERNKLDANLDKGERNLGVWGRKTLPEKLEEAESKYGDMTDEELNEYKMSHGHCVSSKY